MVIPYENLTNKPIPWSLNSQEERSWNFYIHSWDMVDILLYAYNQVAEIKLFEPALNIALDWINLYVDLKSNQPLPYHDNKDLAWYDMAVGLRAYRLAYIYDEYKHNIANDSEDSRDIIVKLWSGLVAHQVYLKQDNNISFHNNHGYYQAAGQIAMGRRFSAESELMEHALNQGVSRFKQMLSQQFTDEGVHREHSPDYHRMVYETLIGVMRAGLIEDKAILKFADKIEESLSWFILPNQRMANFGDSDWRYMGTKNYVANNKWQTPSMKFVTTNGSIGSLYASTYKVFEEAGYFIVRSLNVNESENQVYNQYSYLAQTAAFHSRTHKHADDLSFIWYDRGHNILVDAGRFGYIGKTETGSELWKQGYWYSHPNRLYCESTRAHNTLEFDNTNYARKGVKPYGSATKRHKQYDNGLTVLETECRHNKSIRHARVLIYMPSQWLIVFDWFKDNIDQKHNVKQWFNFDPDLKLEKIGSNFLSKLDDNSELYITNLLDDTMASEIYRGQEEPRSQGWFSPAEREFIPTDSINYYIENLNSGRFVSLFNFNDIPVVNYKINSVSTNGRRINLEWKDNIGVHTVSLIRDIDKFDCKYSIGIDI